MWFYFAILSAIIYSFKGILEKSVLRRSNRHITGFAVRLYALPFLLIPLIVHPKLVVPIDQLDKSFWVSVLYISLISYPIETIFYLKAVKKEEVSLILPILSVAPILTMLFALIILKEVPSVVGIGGMAIATFGIYALKIQHAGQGILKPITHLKNNIAVRYMFIVMVFISMGSVVDKIAMSNTNPFFYAFVSHLLMTIPLFIIALVKAKGHLKEIFSHAGGFAIISLVIVCYTVFYLLALNSGFVCYASAIKSSSVLLTIIWGLAILKERDRKAKIIGGILITIGLVMIKFS